MKVLAFLFACLALTPLLAAETVLLEFTANWCEPCRSMQPIVAGLEREGYHVERVNFDENKAKAAQFRVQGLPTFVALVDGRETGRVVGSTTVDRLRRMLGPVAPTESQKSKDPVSLVAATTDARPHSAVASRTPAEELIQRSVRIVVDDAKARSFGTGTVIRSVQGETLVLSCSHLFEGVPRGSKTTVEFFGSAQPLRLPGELVARDREADVSLVRVNTGQSLPAAPVASRRFVPSPGVPAISVGCDNGQQPSVRQMRITNVNRYLGAPTIECTGQPSQGRSGGGLFNESGELIGVCSAADPSEHKGIYVGLAAVQSLLDRQNLTSLYSPRPAGDQRIVAVSLGAKSSPARLTIPPPEELGLKVSGDSPLLRDASDAELVCVIHPIADPQAPARVIVLSRASEELVALLEKEQAAQNARSATSMRLPSRPDMRPVLKQPALESSSPAAPGEPPDMWRPVSPRK